MKQLSVNSTFLGTSVEEKFHLSAFSLAIIPCIPLVSNRLKNMVHPDVAPIQLEEGVKEGYFMVNLSMTQNFDVEAEFFAMPDYQNDYTGQDNDIDSDTQSHHEDDDEIESPATPRPRPRPRPTREATSARGQHDIDAEDMLEHETEILRGIDRFSNSSSDSEHDNVDNVDNDSYDGNNDNKGDDVNDANDRNNDNNSNNSNDSNDSNDVNSSYGDVSYTCHERNESCFTQQYAKDLAIAKPDNHFDVPQVNTESGIEIEDSSTGSQAGSNFARKDVTMQATSKERRKGKGRATSCLDYLTESEDDFSCEPFNPLSRKRVFGDDGYIEKRVRQRSNTYSSEENSIHRRAEGMHSKNIVDGTPVPHSFNFGRRGRGRPRKHLPTEPQNIPKRKPGRPRKTDIVASQQFNSLNNYFSGNKKKASSTFASSSKLPK